MQQRHENRKAYFQELAATSELHFLPYIHRFTSVTPQSRILEIGCGEGGNLVPFAALAVGLQGLIYPKTASGRPASFFRKKGCPPLSLPRISFKSHSWKKRSTSY